MSLALNNWALFVLFGFLLLILLNSFRMLFIFSRNGDNDGLLLLEKNKGLRLIPLELFPLFPVLDMAICYVLVSASYLAK